jgi:hypothetical protein
MRFIGSLFLIVCSLFSADAYVSKNSVVMGERVVLVLSASGSDVKFPELSSVGGFAVTSTGMQQNMESINGKVSKTIEKHYAFTPLKSIDIAPFEVEVDGKKELTKALHVEVKKADNTNSPFTLEMKINKSDVMQFEAVPVEFIFKRDQNYEVRDLRFSPPKFDNFWVKEGKKTKPELVNGMVVHKMNFFLYPQKSGDFEISPARVDVGVMSKSRDIFNMLTNQLNWKSVFSNTQSLHVKKLEGTNLFGDFYISLSVDKKEIEQNEGVNATLKITGSGNFDDIEPYKLNIDGANIYSDKPTVNSKATIENMQGEFVQKYSISASQDFIIPSVSITYYDAKLKKLVTKKTESISLHVKKSSQEKAVQISEAKPVEKEMVVQTKNNYLYLLLAFISGVLITLLVLFLSKKREYKLPKFKNDRERLKSLLKRRGESEEIDEQIREIEKKLYL